MMKEQSEVAKRIILLEKESKRREKTRDGK
jgi:hypothetical protein